MPVCPHFAENSKLVLLTYTAVKAGEMAQSVKGLLLKHEDLTQDPQHPQLKPGM